MQIINEARRKSSRSTSQEIYPKFLSICSKNFITQLYLLMTKEINRDKVILWQNYLLPFDKKISLLPKKKKKKKKKGFQ